MLLIVVFLSVLVAIITAVILARDIGAPIRGMTQPMYMLARSDLNINISAINRRNEISEMVDAVQVFKDNAREMSQLREQQHKDREHTKPQ